MQNVAEIDRAVYLVFMNNRKIRQVFRMKMRVIKKKFPYATYKLSYYLQILNIFDINYYREFFLFRSNKRET